MAAQSILSIFRRFRIIEKLVQIILGVFLDEFLSNFLKMYCRVCPPSHYETAVVPVVVSAFTFLVEVRSVLTESQLVNC